MSLADRFAAEMGRLLGPDFPDHIALAVSGGGDSMAMLALAHEWARVFGVKLWVVTVDHGLRDGSADEAAMVARECAGLGHPHAALRWKWDGQGNLQDAARRARLDLIDRWRGGIEHVLMAHTQDDVAETFVMRLARGSGVEGLSAMADIRVVTPHRSQIAPVPLQDEVVDQAGQRPPMPPDRSGRFILIRPLLNETRAGLRHHVVTLKVPFVDDPTNNDLTYDRARIRSALRDLGIDTDTLAETARRMARAGDALRARAVSVARDCVLSDGFGSLTFDRDSFANVERDTQFRLLSAALCWTGSAPYRPRGAATEALLDRVLAGGSGTLHGAQVEVTPDQFRVFREYEAVRGLIQPTGRDRLWDRRWLVCGPAIAGLSLRALGDDGWTQIRDRQASGPSHSIARTLPAVFDGNDLVAFAPHGYGRSHVAELRPPAGQFITFLESR